MEKTFHLKKPKLWAWTFFLLLLGGFIYLYTDAEFLRQKPIAEFILPLGIVVMLYVLALFFYNSFLSPAIIIVKNDRFLHPRFPKKELQETHFDRIDAIQMYKSSDEQEGMISGLLVRLKNGKKRRYSRQSFISEEEFIDFHIAIKIGFDLYIEGK